MLLLRVQAVLALLSVMAPATVIAYQGDERQSRVLPGRRLDAPPRIDAVLDDAAWQVEPATGFWDRELGSLVEDQTRFWVGYDDEALYAAFHLQDRNPAGIVGRETRRNVGFEGEDRLRFYLNAFGTLQREDFSLFAVNPLGTHSSMIAGGRAAKLEWRGDWTSAGRVVGDGWIVEIAIPWQILPRPSGELGPRDLTFEVERFQARTLITSMWNYHGPGWRMDYAGRLTGVRMPAAKAVNPLSLLWYGFTGYDDPGAAGRMGVDARYQFNPQLTGVLSVNPDFGNIEAAVTTIDFSYAEVLGDETRPFFQEGAGFFGGPRGAVRPFASQRIGAFDAGAKVFGKLGPNTNVGALGTVEMGQRTDAVVNVSHNFAPRTGAMFAAVTRNERDLDNTVFGGSFAHGFGDWTVGGTYFGSRDRAGDGESGGTMLSWVTRNWNFQSGYQFVSPEYRARNGFVPFRDQRGVWASGGFEADWRRGLISELEVEVDAQRFFRYGGRLFRESAELSAGIETRTLWRVRAGHEVGRFLDYRDRRTNVSVEYPMNNRFRSASIGYSWGRQGGANIDVLEVDANWQLFGRLQLGASTEWVRRIRSEAQHVFRASFDFSPAESIGGRVLVRNGRASAFLTYRRSGFGGLEYFAILGDPAADGFRPRLVFKVVGAL